MKRAVPIRAMAFALLVALLPVSRVYGFANGDMNGDGKISIADAIVLLQSAVGLRAATASEIARADVNDNGKLDIQDVVVILQIVTGLHPSIPTGGPLVGRLAVQIHQAAASDVLAYLQPHADMLRAAHITLTPTGIDWRPAYPPDWVVQVGDRVILTDKYGYFTLADWPAGVQSGQIMREIGQPALVTFSRHQLVAPTDRPIPVTLDAKFKGPCGMNGPADCHTTLPQNRTVSGAVFLDAPPINSQEEGCLDYDGPFGSGVRSDNTAGTMLNAYLSTCHAWVARGCCINEFMGGPSCWLNHKYRNCQNLNPDDLVLSPTSITVKPGESVTIDVLNNTCQNDTLLSFQKHDAGGSLVADGEYKAYSVVHHFNDAAKVHLENRTVVYVAPSCLPPGVTSAVDVITSIPQGANGSFVPVTITVQGPCVASTGTTPAGVVSTVQIAGPTLLLVGDTVTLTAIALDSTGAVILDQNVTWSTSNTAVATAGALNGSSHTGVVQGVSDGTVQVTATVGGVTSAPFVVKVAKVPVPISGVTPPPPPDEQTATIEVDGVGNVFQGDTIVLNAYPKNKAGAVLYGKKVTWASADPGIASVGPIAGSAPVWTEVGGVKPGMTSVTASVDGATSEPHSVRVLAPIGSSTAGVRITLYPPTVTLEPGASGYPFIVDVTGADNTAADYSTDGGSVKTAPSGNVLYTAPLVEGVYHVTATSRADPGKTATSTITVAGKKTLRVAGAFTGGSGGCKSAIPNFFDLVTVTIHGSQITIDRDGSPGNTSSGTLAADGTFTASRLGDTYSGKIDGSGEGTATFRSTDAAGCTTTWQVRLTPSPLMTGLKEHFNNQTFTTEYEVRTISPAGPGVTFAWGIVYPGDPCGHLVDPKSVLATNGFYHGPAEAFPNGCPEDYEFKVLIKVTVTDSKGRAVTCAFNARKWEEQGVVSPPPCEMP